MTPATHVSSHISKMAARMPQCKFSAREVVERVLQAGSDEEEDVVGAFSDSDRELLDSDDDYIPVHDDEWLDVSDNEMDADHNTANSGGEENETDMPDVPPTTTNSDTDMQVDDHNDGGDDYMRDWYKNLVDFPLSVPFTGTPELQGPLLLPPWEQCKPVHFYRLFITNGILKHMQTETDRYARQVTDQKQQAGVHLSPRSKFRTWKNVTVNEMTRFLAITIHIGIVKKPRIVDYWLKIPVPQTTFASKLMKCDRFQAILSFFHLNDTTSYVPFNNSNQDLLHKLRRLIDHLIHGVFHYLIL